MESNYRIALDIHKLGQIPGMSEHSEQCPDAASSIQRPDAMWERPRDEQQPQDATGSPQQTAYRLGLSCLDCSPPRLNPTLRYSRNAMQQAQLSSVANNELS